MSLDRFKRRLKYYGKLLSLEVLLSMPLLATIPKKIDAQQIYGQVIDVITGQGIPNIEVVNEGIDSTLTDLNGNYILDVVWVAPLPRVAPGAGHQIRMPGADIFNVRGQKLGSLKENQTLENFLTTKNIANGVYLIKTDPKINNNIISTGKALRLESNVIWGGTQSLKSYNLNSSKSFTRSLDDNYFVNLKFKDEDDTFNVGDYFDIERDSLLVPGNLEQNEEMIPTWMTKQSNPFDTVFVDYDYMTEVFPAWVGSVNATTWKTLGYDSIGVYIPETPPQANVDLHQAALNSIQGIMEIDDYNGYNTLVSDLNRANNYPVFHIVEDCTYVVDNGGIYFVFTPDVPTHTGIWISIREPPSPLYEIDIDTDLTDFLYSTTVCAHESGHCLGYSQLSSQIYPNSIMANFNAALNYYIDDQTAAVTAIQHNRTDPAYYIIKNK